MNIKNIESEFNKMYCQYYIKKNGKIIYIPNNIYKEYLCIIKNIKLIDSVIFPYLYGQNEDDILKKLKILYIIQKKKFKYFRLYEPVNKDKNYRIILFDESKKDVVFVILFYIYMVKNNEEFKKTFCGTKLRLLTSTFMIYKLIFTNRSDKEILIMCFYPL